MKNIFMLFCGLGLMAVVGCAPTIQGVAEFGINIEEKPYRIRTVCENLPAGHEYVVECYRGKCREYKRTRYVRVCREVKEYYEPRRRHHRWR